MKQAPRAAALLASSNSNNAPPLVSSPATRLDSPTSMASSTEDKRFTKHGFPKGFRFVPTHLELITILSRRIHGRPLNRKVADVFHELKILDHHPEELHDEYEDYKEDRYIYFFSRREFQKPAGAAAGCGPVHKKRQRGAGGQDEDDNEPRPVRLAKGGGWKPSGGGHVLRWPKDKGGFVAGKMVTMVFYDHHDEGRSSKEQVKSQWGMHEFTVPVDPGLISKPSKSTRLHDLALYRLYKLNKSDDMESVDGAGSNQTLANVSAAEGHYFSAPAGAGQPSLGIFNGRNQPLAAGASTSRMPPPQQQQHHIPNVGHPQFYHHHQYGFGAAPASAAAHQRVHTIPMPLAYGGAGMLPGRQLFQLARPPGTGLPGRQSFQFARPPAPAPAQMPVPPAAANPASSHQAPAKATYSGAGQEASHSGTTRWLPSAPVATPPPAAERPSAEELAPMTAAHGDAGQEASGSFGGATRSSPAAGSLPAEQDATATAEPGQHVQFAGCVKPEEEVPSPIPADNYDDGIGMVPDLGAFEERYLFSMDELCATFDEAPPMQQGDNN